VPRYGPVSRRDLVAGLRRLGFDGPYAGSKHEFMVRQQTKVRLPNPHRGAIGLNLLSRILQEAGITREAWEEA
jgi:hypothetical protein